MGVEIHVCGIIIEDGKMLLTQRSLHDTSEAGKWCPINETAEENEPIRLAVVRGAKEEVGVKFTIIKRFKPTLFKDKTTPVFIGKRSGEIKIQEEEVEQYQWLTYDEAIRLDFAYGYEKLIEDIHNHGLF